MKWGKSNERAREGKQGPRHERFNKGLCNSENPANSVLSFVPGKFMDVDFFPIAELWIRICQGCFFEFAEIISPKCN